MAKPSTPMQYIVEKQLKLFRCLNFCPPLKSQHFWAFCIIEQNQISAKSKQRLPQVAL